MCCFSYSGACVGYLVKYFELLTVSGTVALCSVTEWRYRGIAVESKQSANLSISQWTENTFATIMID